MQARTLGYLARCGKHEVPWRLAATAQDSTMQRFKLGKRDALRSVISRRSSTTRNYTTKPCPVPHSDYMRDERKGNPRHNGESARVYHQKAAQQFKLHTVISIWDSAHLRRGVQRTWIAWRYCRAARCCQLQWRPSTCAITVRSGQTCLLVVWRPTSPVPLAGKDTASQVGRQCYSSGAIPLATSASRFEDERHRRSCPPTCLCSTIQS